SYTYNNPWNRLDSTTGATYTYDANGNTLSKTAAIGITQYTWDYENRLISVTLPGTNGTITFQYDPFGKRIQKSSPSGTINFLYDGKDIIEEVDANSNQIARFTQGPGIDQPLAVTQSGATSYYEADSLGSITSLSGAAGTITDTYTYDSFGNSTGSTGNTIN